jgi:hypothetical protein
VEVEAPPGDERREDRREPRRPHVERHAEVAVALARGEGPRAEEVDGRVGRAGSRQVVPGAREPDEAREARRDERGGDERRRCEEPATLAIARGVGSTRVGLQSDPARSSA